MFRFPRAPMRAMAFLSTVTLILVACDKHEAQMMGAPIAVAILQVQPKSLPFVIEAVGRTEGSREIEIRARVSGILEKRLYVEGAPVRAGATLFRIEREPFEIAVERAHAALASERARNQLAHRNADRVVELFNQKLVSQNDVDTAMSTMRASDAAILTAQVNIREAELNLSYTNVTAPIGGITGRALRSDGTLVAAGTDSGMLTTMTQANPIWARFALSSAEYDALRSATKNTAELVAELVHRDGSVAPQKGRVNFAASTVDTNLGTVQLRAEFANPGLDLLPGEYVRVRLTGGAQNTITVPQTAVLQGAKGPFVWIVNAERQAEQRAVKTGAWIGDEWRINEGLVAGDVIILNNLLKLKPGQAVSAETSSLPAATSASAPATG
ncbi:MAG TPA: efflux RND transporter periplasmic adaptor subunit [Steroidobacteraceae bacterium]|nr:efflux RND transporter periplasmic adaptor subunit [Steroidobacteraceae bacterium]